MLNKIIKVIILLHIFFYKPGFAQTAGAYSFSKSSVPVYDSLGNQLGYPFAGGMNNCQYGQMDLNNDGVKDLIVFDRHGNRILPFINQNRTGTINYTFHPEYASGFPEMEQWMQLLDYDKDGKEDVFTYTTGGIKVFHNESAGILKFRQVTNPYLTSLQGSAQTNILVTSADFPAIADLDNDGDLDILTFWGLGSFVEFHRNMSVEQTGQPNILTFQKESGCWGRFAEGLESNKIKLDTCPPGVKSIPTLRSETKHTGSTLAVSDYNGDGLPDLVIGDVDYPQLVQLTNGGSSASARMISQTTDFPNAANPVNLTSFPAACLVDVNNDGRRDLLVSSFDPGLTRSESIRSSLLYLDKGTGSIPGYTFQTNQFLQSEMIDLGSGAYPVFFDYNKDGLKDLVVGNYGILDSAWIDPAYGLRCRYHSALALFQNTGNPVNPQFKLITRDYGGLSAIKTQGLCPAFADLDGDGDQDMLCGSITGQLMYFENTAGSGQAAKFTLRSLNYQGIDVGDFSAPQLVDIENDGLPDLICGKRDGRLSYFHNTGTAALPLFTRMTDNMGNVNTTDTTLSIYGFSVPCCFRDKDNKLRLFVGSENGDIYSYSDIENNLTGKFHSNGKSAGIREGWRTGIAVADLDGDSYIEAIIGNYAGGLGFMKGTEPGSSGEEPSASILLMPNPASGLVAVQLNNLDGWLIEKVDLYDVRGRKILSETGDGSDTMNLDTERLSSGIYFVVVIAKSQNTGSTVQINEKLLVVR